VLERDGLSFLGHFHCGTAVGEWERMERPDRSDDELVSQHVHRSLSSPLDYCRVICMATPLVSVGDLGWVPRSPVLSPARVSSGVDNEKGVERRPGMLVRTWAGYPTGDHEGG